MAYIVMACINTAYMIVAFDQEYVSPRYENGQVVAYVVTAYIVITHIVMAYIVMACINMACMIMASIKNIHSHIRERTGHGLYSYGLYSYGLYSYGLYS